MRADAVTHSISQLVSFLDSHQHITYLRMGAVPAHAAAGGWDAPCVEEVLTLPVPVVFTPGWMNNAHFGRASALSTLLPLVLDSSATGAYGLECHAHFGRMSMFSMCHHVTFRCEAADPFFLTPAVCDTSDHLPCGQLVDTFKQVNNSYCADAAGRRPQFQHCGLAVYGPFGHASARHLDGKVFDLAAFWQGGPPAINSVAPGLADWAVRPSEQS